MLQNSPGRFTTIGAAAAGRWRYWCAVGLLLLGTMQSAHAYLDPGTGSILLQGLIAGVAATAAYIGIYWRRIKAFFSRSPGSEARGPAGQDPPTQDPPP